MWLDLVIIFKTIKVAIKARGGPVGPSLEEELPH